MNLTGFRDDMVIVVGKSVLSALESLLERSEGCNGIHRISPVKRNGQWICLGEGGEAKVYEVTDKGDGKNYALKISVRREDEQMRIAENLLLQKKLSCESDHIVKVHDVWVLEVLEGEDGNCIVTGVPDLYESRMHKMMVLTLMEKLEGVLSLNEEDRMTFCGNRILRERDAAEFALHIGRAVLKLHENKIMHGDIRLENVYYDKERLCYKLGDFDGIVKEGDTEGIVRRTVGYSVPGRGWQRGRAFDKKEDIYALGICLFLLLNELKFPYSTGYYESKMLYRYLLPFPAPRHATGKMKHLIRRMCRRKRQRRIGSIEQVIEELSNIEFGDEGGYFR